MIAAQPLEALIRVTTDDLFKALGLDGLRRGQALARALCRPVALRFARRLLEFDRRIGAEGLAGASRFMLQAYRHTVRASGRQHLPAEGPLLLMSNHPGLSDSIALFACLPRDDLRILGGQRDFLSAIPNIERRLFPFRDDPAGRASAVRAAIHDLRRGGALLTYPSGQIEPDPAIAAGAAEALAHWSDSLGMFARTAPQTRLVPVIVRGVYSPRAYHHPLTRLRRAQKDRDWLAAMLQVIVPAYHRADVRVAIGEPLLGRDLLTPGRDPAAVTRAVTAAARRLIEAPPEVWETIVE